MAVLGDVGSDRDGSAIRRRLNVLCGPQVPASARPTAIEVATNVDLGPNLDQFAPIDALAKLAAAGDLKLFLRVKPRVQGLFARAVVRSCKSWEPVKTTETDQISFLDLAYQEAVNRYFAAVAAHCAEEPSVVGIGIGICPSGETQYPITGDGFGDFSPAALADYRAWMKTECGREVTDWPPSPPLVAEDTCLSGDADYYRWAFWRVKRIADLVGGAARAIRARAPRLFTYAFSYMGLACPAGYGPGFLEDDPNIDGYFSNISLDQFFFAQRGEDRSRPVTMGSTRKINLTEFDLISAYTDPVHMEACARMFCLMGGQPRPFLPTWWGPGKTGGWSEGFWAPYSDELAREMSRVVSDSLPLRRTASVADTAVIVPNVSGMGTMARWGPWASSEFKASHTDIVRHLSAVGANYDILTEDTITAAKLAPYRLVIVVSPALYPWVRDALARCNSNVLALGWAGTIVTSGGRSVEHVDGWSTDAATWWPTGGHLIRRNPRVRFTEEALNGALRGREVAYPTPGGTVPYVGGMGGTALARDDQGNSVVATARWGRRRIYHFGLPLMLRQHGAVLTDALFRELLTNILRDCRCTAYGDLGPLRLYETTHYLLVENPSGTTGTVDRPRGDFEGSLPNRLHHRPGAAFLTGKGEIRLAVPAGKSVLIPLEQ